MTSDIGQKKKGNSCSLLDFVFGKVANSDEDAQDLGDRKLPLKVLGAIQNIEKGFVNFTITLVDDSRNFEVFNEQLQKHYKEAEIWADNPDPEDLECTSLAGTYFPRMYFACVIDSEVFRCRIVKLSGMEAEVLLIDYGTGRKVPIASIYKLNDEFSDGELGFPFVLRCATADPQCVEHEFNLPKLKNFHPGNIVEVIICTSEEPCLALIGSAEHIVHSLNPKMLLPGLDTISAKIWTNLFTKSSIDAKAVVSGTFPRAQLPPNASNFISTVIGFKSLDSTFVRDLLSSARLCFLQNILNEFYTNEKNRTELAFKDLSVVAVGLPCIIYDKGQYLRAKVEYFSYNRTVADLIAVDHPLLVFRDVSMAGDKVFSLAEDFNVAPQCIPIQLARANLSKIAEQHDAMKKVRALQGAVVSIKIPLKSALAVMSAGEQADVLATEPVDSDSKKMKLRK